VAGRALLLDVDRLLDAARASGGQLVLQGRGSCMAAHALAPLPGWLVVDACAAPGNKTTHLAALMQGRGTVVAFDADQARLLRLKAAVTRAGASRVIQPRLADFLAQSHAHPPLSSAQALLLDPSCSGSGTRLSRGDALLPSAGDRGGAGAQRVAALSRFQLAALRHALRAPALRRLVYSTCSLDAVENERVVAQALSEAELLGWRSISAASSGSDAPRAVAK
jgi:putative methyltransferase